MLPRLGTFWGAHAPGATPATLGCQPGVRCLLSEIIPSPGLALKESYLLLPSVLGWGSEEGAVEKGSLRMTVGEHGTAGRRTAELITWGGET